MDAIALSCASGTLTFVTDERGWCRVGLETASGSMALGAERLPQIAARLVAFLTSRAGGVRWVVCLSDLTVGRYEAMLAVSFG